MAAGAESIRIADVEPKVSPSAKPRTKANSKAATTKGAMLATWTSSGCFLLAAVILGISMPHLQSGAVRICKCSPITGWLIAVVFDLSQVLAELATLIAPAFAIATKVKRPTQSIIICSSFVSISLNVDAFVADADGWKPVISGTIAGVLLPLGVLALCFLGSTFWMARNSSVPIVP